MIKTKHNKKVLATPLGIPKRQFPKESIVQLQSGPIVAGNKEPAGLALSDNDVLLLADLGTNLWRARQRLQVALEKGAQGTDVKKVLRPIESAIETIEKMGMKILDFSGQLYVHGMAINVVTSQPNSSLSSDRICETLKPTIYFRQRFIQAGDVIIEGPPSPAEIS